MNYRLFLLILFLSLFSFGKSVLGQKNPPKNVTVGVYENNPKVFVDEKGQPAGFWIEIVDNIAKTQNWSLNYLTCQWEQCLILVQQGKIDLMVDVAYSPERDRHFDFNNEVVLASWSQVYSRDGLKLQSILDLDQKKVGILQSSIQQEVINEQIKSFSIKPQLIEVKSFDDIFQLLEKKELDAGIVNNFFGKKISPNYNVEKTNILLNPVRLHFIVKKGDPKSLLSEIDRQLEVLIQDPNSIYYQSIDEWLDPQKKFGWPQVKIILLNLIIYSPFFALVGVTLWSFSLKKEVQRRRVIEATLQESQQNYISLANAVPVGIFRMNLDRKCIYVNEYCCELMGISPQEIFADGWLKGIHPDDRELVKQHWFKSIQENTIFELEYRLQPPDRPLIWVYGQCLAEKDQEGNIKGYVGTLTDISDRVSMESQLKHDALHDKLTGLANRNLLIERLKFALQRDKRNGENQFAVLFLDLDNFKIVNDSLGHLMGDHLLIEVAKLLKNIIRETDLAARLGGDEFVILLEEINGIEESVRIAERILQAFKMPFYISNREVFINSSIGIIISNQDYNSAQNLLRDADIAMYKAKQNGKGKYAIFDPTMHWQALQRLHLENDLRKAIENNQFTLYYQPIVNLETRIIEGFEALIRWQHPEKGFLSPLEFITIAEETGLIISLGKWILETAGQQLSIWQKKYNENLKIHVNLSVKQLQESLLPLLDEILAKYPLKPYTLGLEITESMLITNIQVTRTLLEQIKNKYITISIDDFGTGYSCFSYLHKLPVDSLKIDRSFVNISELNSQNQVIAESIITLSQSIGLKTIAEGVETEEQCNWLQSLNCQFGQGYFFSRPVDATIATQLLEKTPQYT